MYKLRVTTTVEQIDHDGRVLFSMTDTVDESTIDESRNQVDVPAAFLHASADLVGRMRQTLCEQYQSRKTTASNSRQQIVDMFGDSCPVCEHSIAKFHPVQGKCVQCGKDCENSLWPPESMAQFVRYRNYRSAGEESGR